MRSIYLFLFLLILLQGCGSKQSHITVVPVVSQDSQKELILNKESDDEESDDDFEDEFTDEESEELLDPLSGYNRLMTSFNDKVFTYALNPLSEGYITITPEPIRQSLSNFIHNLQFPIRFANNLLQGKFQNTSDELKRFIVNSTFGIAGLFDPASTHMNIPSHDEDFGQTLGHYGVGAGFHIVLPFLGPSSIRDVIGITADGYTSPLVYDTSLNKYRIPQNYGQTFGIRGFEAIDKNAQNLGAYESLKKDAIELYPFLRDVYEQKRTEDIKK